MGISRRRFIETTAAGTLAAQASAQTTMPTRTLGKTGVKVSVVAFGSGSRWLAYKDEAKAHEAMTKALDMGVTYVDTAYAYGNGQSETWIGNLLGERRNPAALRVKLVRNQKHGTAGEASLGRTAHLPSPNRHAVQSSSVKLA